MGSFCCESLGDIANDSRCLHHSRVGRSNQWSSVNSELKVNPEANFEESKWCGVFCMRRYLEGTFFVGVRLAWALSIRGRRVLYHRACDMSICSWHYLHKFVSTVWEVRIRILEHYSIHPPFLTDVQVRRNANNTIFAHFISHFPKISLTVETENDSQSLLKSSF
jgi:hypothetical protein